tara:strand:- start:12668 stop:12814 length:147 start_codon:yes stop_codon:yes gene_type:complete
VRVEDNFSTIEQNKIFIMIIMLIFIFANIITFKADDTKNSALVVNYFS